jgi:hypothetical protein
MKKANLIPLLMLPCLLFGLGLVMKNEVGFYHLHMSDPAYAFLFNGLTICRLHFPFLVQGPGTPLEVFCALVIGFVHLFRCQDSLVADVMKNPELYLNVINTSLLSLQGIALFLMGFTVSRSSKSLLTGLFLQLTPFVSGVLIELLRYVMAENLIATAIFCLIIVVFLYLKHHNNQKRAVDWYLILFSVIIGFIASCKLLYLPVAVIPFLLLPGYRKKLLYILFSVTTFFIFSFNLINNWESFRDFYIGNFFHSGQYGAGPATIIDLKTYPENLQNVFFSDRIYFIAFLIIIASAVLYHMPFSRVRQKNDKEYRTLLGIAVTMTIMSLLVAKQFKYYYMSTALLLIVPGLYLVFKIFSRSVSKIIKVIVFLPCTLFLLFLISCEVTDVIKNHPRQLAKKEVYMQTMQYIEHHIDKDRPTLVIPDYYGAPYKEYGLFFGIGWSGHGMRMKFAAELKKLYPDIYFYHVWDDLFNHWDYSYAYIDLLKKYKRIIMFSGDPVAEESISGKLHGLNRQFDTRTVKTIKFETTGEGIYEILYDSVSDSQPFKFRFDAESTDSSGKFFLSTEGIRVGDGGTRSTDFARSGKYSGKLTNEAPYGFTGIISEACAGEKYKVSVWRFNNSNNNAGLVISAKDASRYYHLETQPSADEKRWQKISIDFEMPQHMDRQDIKIYCWNNDKTMPAYFDDLLIEKITDE